MKCKNKKHPKKPNNLRKGECGTCYLIGMWEKASIEAKEMKNNKLIEACNGMIDMFNKGIIYYDSGGKTLLEIEKEMEQNSQEKTLTE